MKMSFRRGLSACLIALAVMLAVVGVSAADCAGNNHALHYAVTDGALRCTCTCGAVRLTAEKNAEGGPVIYVGTQDSDAADGSGMTPDDALVTPEALEQLLGAYKAGGAPQPMTVVVVGVFSAAADFSIDAGNRVTFTSDWNGVDYASEDNGYARLYWNTNVHCFNDMVFDKVIFEHPKAGRYIGLNGHDLTVTDVRYFSAAAGNKLITSIRSTALYGILSGDFLTVNYLGADLSGLNQTITVDSGMWLCVDVGCYRSLKESAFSDMSGKVTVNLSGTVQVINRATGAPTKFRGISAASQIVSTDGLQVVYNISGGNYVLNNGLNVVGRDSQAPDAARNIHVTYNITGGSFNACPVYATVRPELTASIPTAGKVVFNVAEGLDLGEHTLDETKDAYNVGTVPTEGGEDKPEPEIPEEDKPIGAMPFADVTVDKWFARYVALAYEKGLVSGTSATAFSPDSHFTVAQALIVAVNIHKAQAGTSVRAAESGEAWYAPYVEYCTAHGIAAADRFDTYDRNITRGEMALVFANILPDDAYEKVRDGINPDVAVDAAYAAAVTRLYQAGIVSGDDKGNYRPDDEILRSEACVIFTRIAVPEERAK